MSVHFTHFTNTIKLNVCMCYVRWEYLKIFFLRILYNEMFCKIKIKNKKYKKYLCVNNENSNDI